MFCLCTNPDYLLIDVMASKRDSFKDTETTKCFDALVGRLTTGWGFVAMYVLSPEKFVTWAAFKGGVGRKKLGACMGNILLIGGVLLDLCGVAALWIGLQPGNHLPDALAVGYSATALGGVSFIMLIIQGLCCRCACCCGRSARPRP